MKKLALALVLGTFTMGVVSAQTTQKTKIKTEKKAENKVGHEKKEHQDKTPEQRAEMQAQRMQKKFNLTDDQTVKIREINLAKAQRMESLKGQNKENREAMGAETKDVKSNWENQLKSILTPDQYAKYEKERAERMEKRKEKHGDHKQGGHKDIKYKNKK